MATVRKRQRGNEVVRQETGHREEGHRFVHQGGRPMRLQLIAAVKEEFPVQRLGKALDVSHSCVARRLAAAAPDRILATVLVAELRQCGSASGITMLPVASPCCQWHHHAEGVHGLARSGAGGDARDPLRDGTRAADAGGLGDDPRVHEPSRAPKAHPNGRLRRFLLGFQFFPGVPAPCGHKVDQRHPRRGRTTARCDPPATAGRPSARPARVGELSIMDMACRGRQRCGTCHGAVSRSPRPPCDRPRPSLAPAR